MAASSLTGINYGAQLLKGSGGLGGYPTEQVNTDLQRLYNTGIRMVRIASTSENEGSSYSTFARTAVQAALDIGFTTILYGKSTTFPSKTSTWEAHRQQKLLDAAYVATLDVSKVHLLLTNESDAQFNMGSESGVTVTRSGSLLTITTSVAHGASAGNTYVLSGVDSLNPASTVTASTIVDDFTFTYTTGFGGSDGTLSTGSLQNTPSTFRSKIRALATEIKNSYPTVQTYASIAQGNGAGWISDGSHEGDLTHIAFNIYGETFGNSKARFDNFVSQTDAMYAQFGSKLWVTEWSLHASFGSFPAGKEEQRIWIKRRYDYLESKGIPHYFYTYRSNSYTGDTNDSFAAKYTWSDGGISSLYTGLNTKSGGGERWFDILARKRKQYIDL